MCPPSLHTELPDGAQVGPDRGLDRTQRKSFASAGFGSPGEDVTVRRISLDDALIRHPQSTFLMRAAGGAMTSAGIADGDVLLVDRAIVPAHGHVVVAVLDGELVCRRLYRARGRARLQTADLAPDRPAPGDDAPLEIWGVVTTVIRRLVD